MGQFPPLRDRLQTATVSNDPYFFTKTDELSDPPVLFDVLRGEDLNAEPEILIH